MSVTQVLYSCLPAGTQNLVCSLQGWSIRHRRYGAGFRQLFQESEDRARWSHEQWVEFRDRRLAEYVREVAATAPFYQRRFHHLGIDPARCRSLEDLRQLPILTKCEVREHAREMRAADPQGRLIAMHTSGTTGSGLRFFSTVRAEQEQWAVWWRYRRWHGIDFNTWCGYFGGRAIVPLSRQVPAYWRVNIPGRQVMFSGYHMSPANLPFYVAELRRRRLPWLHGYPSLLTALAAYLVESGGDPGYPVRWITTGAENLLPHQAEVIRRAFGVKPRQHYGMAEAVANLSECESGRLHVDEDFAAVEFIPTGNSQTCRVAGTNFTNSAVALLRYDTGDVVTLLEGTCGCGRPGRLVERVDGREEDYVLLRNGARIGRMDHIFKDAVRVREAQIYQTKPGELIYRIVRGGGYTGEDERRLLDETELRLGDQASVRFEYVRRIERTSTGKLRFVLSEIPEARLRGQDTPRQLVGEAK